MFCPFLYNAVYFVHTHTKKVGRSMKKEDIQLLREIVRNAERGMRTIDLLKDKIYDDSLAIRLTGQSLHYAQLKNRAVEGLLRGRMQPPAGSRIEDMILAGELKRDTLFDTSTSHMAELMIRQENRGITKMSRSLNQCAQASRFCTEIATEFVAFEEKNIVHLRKYL